MPEEADKIVDMPGQRRPLARRGVADVPADNEEAVAGGFDRSRVGARRGTLDLRGP